MILITGANGVVGRQSRSSHPSKFATACSRKDYPRRSPARLLGSLADYATQPDPTTHTVEDLLGRPELTFANWAHDNATAFSP